MKAVKVGIIGASLCAAVAITFFFGGSEVIPDDPSTETLWQCVKCEHSFKLTLPQLTKELSKVGDQPPIFCPKCNQREAWQPMACFRCSTLFFGPEVPGVPGICPKCPIDDQPAPIIEEAPRRPASDGPPNPDAAPERPRPKQV